MSKRGIAIDTLHRRLEHERDYSRRELLSEIRNLTDRLKRAKEAIEAGERVDPHLVANSAMVTETVARWNVAREMLPFLQMEEK